ncbi:MAG: hypothetical protein ACT4P7_03690 [Gemmatimonadaceae bacterium]
MSARTFLTTAAAVVLWPLLPLTAQVRPPVPHDSLPIGGRIIPAGTTVEGPVVVAGGNLDVRGTIQGSAISIAADVVVRPGGRVTGDAIAAFGDVRNEGTISGSVKALTGTFGASLRGLFASDEAAGAADRSPVNLALGWFTVMMLIGLGVLVFASQYLDGVVDVLGQSFWRSFLTGLLGELGILPAILLVCVALAITVIGALLIPFAVVALVLAVAGLATLGFVAVARLTGDGLGGRRVMRLSSRGGALRGVVVGLAVYMGLWLIAAALNSTPVAGTILRMLALLVTFVAVTAGFGAALLSRGGTKRDAAVIVAPAPAMDAAWQTPTPVAGVVAARRPSRPKVEAGSGQ